MRINEEQRRVLDSLKVERISDDDTNVNIRLIDLFENCRVNQKDCALRNKASQYYEA